MLFVKYGPVKKHLFDLLVFAHYNSV